MVARTRKPVYFVSWFRDADTGLPALKDKQKRGIYKTFPIFYIELNQIVRGAVSKMEGERAVLPGPTYVPTVEIQHCSILS